MDRKHSMSVYLHAKIDTSPHVYVYTCTWAKITDMCTYLHAYIVTSPHMCMFLQACIHMHTYAQTHVSFLMLENIYMKYRGKGGSGTCSIHAISECSMRSKKVYSVSSRLEEGSVSAHIHSSQLLILGEYISNAITKA